MTKGIIRTIPLSLALLISFSISAPIQAQEAESPEIIYISGGGPTGLYTHTAKKIATYLNDNMSRAEGDPVFEALVTGGSQENIENLLSGKSQLAIVQSDILHGQKESIEEKIYAIASLFPEYTQILVRKDNDIENVIQLVCKRVFIGKRGSGAEVNAKNVLSSAGINTGADTESETACEQETLNEAKKEEAEASEKADYLRIYNLTQQNDPAKVISNTEAMKAVRSKDIDAAFRVTGSIFPKLAEWRDDLTLVDLTPDLQAAILGDYPFYGTTRINIEGKSFNTLFTRAVLVASENLKLRDDQIRGLTEFVHKELPVAFQKGLEKQNAAIFREKKIVSGLPIEFQKEAKKYFKANGLLKNNGRSWAILVFVIWVAIIFGRYNEGSRTTSERWVDARYPGLPSAIYQFTLGQAHWLASTFSRYLSSFFRGFKGFFKSPVTYIVIAAIIFLGIAAVSILTFESYHASQNDLPNQFENMPITAFLIWLLQILSLGESPDGLFPKSVAGKAVTVIIPIIGVAGAILAVLMATIREKSAKERRARGLDIPPLKDHFVMCGWNGHGGRVINEFTTEIPGSKPQHIAVLAESKLEKPLEELGVAKANAHYFRGMSSDSGDLERVSAQKASGFLVLAGESKNRRRNFRSIFTVQMIARALAGIDESRRPRIMVDMAFKKNLELFRVAGADRVLNTRLIGSVFLAYSALNMGFSNVITSLMSLATRPVLSRANAKDHKKVFRKVVGMNFSRAWDTLFRSGINLLAIIPHDGETSPTVGIYPDLPNPMIIGENDYMITNEDSLVIIENQDLRNRNVSAVSFADSHTDIQNGLDHSTPLVVIDRRNEAGEELRSLLERRCSDLYYICAEDTLRAEDDHRFIVWDGKIESISEIVQKLILDDLDRQGKAGKVKFLIPSVENPLNYKSTEAVHKDDETVALILQLKTLDDGRFHYTAEIQSMENLHLFKGVNVQQPIPVHEFASLALTKMTLFDGEVTGLILRLMENFFTGELENKSLRKISLEGTGIADQIIGLTYVEAAKQLFPEGIQLLAIISHDGIDQNNRLVALPRKREPDFKYRIHPEDELFVIS